MTGLLLLFLFGGCKTKAYAPPAKEAQVDSVEVSIRNFEGRPDAVAVVKGHLSSSVSQLVDAKQSRQGKVLQISVMEQTPRGAVPPADLGKAPTFERGFPIDILGLEPGKYTVVANGKSAVLEIPEVFDVPQQNFAQQNAPHKVKWRPAPLPAGTVKMMPPVQVNRQPFAPQQIARTTNAQTASDPFSQKNQPLPPGMSASVSMAPPSPRRTGFKAYSRPVKKEKEKPSENTEDVPTVDKLLGQANTVSTLSNSGPSGNLNRQGGGAIKDF